MGAKQKSMYTSILRANSCKHFEHDQDKLNMMDYG